MLLRHLAFVTLLAGTSPLAAVAQSTGDTSSGLSLELNTMDDLDDVCRLTFIATNNTGTAIEAASFETVVFDTDGVVKSLSLFEFRDLPVDRLRVRRFALPELPCSTIGKVLINGANTCVVNGSESDICMQALSLNSRVDVEFFQ